MPPQRRRAVAVDVRRPRPSCCGGYRVGALRLRITRSPERARSTAKAIAAAGVSVPVVASDVDDS